MGKERDRLIRRLGGRPAADTNPSDGALIQAYCDYYRKAGRLPPEIAALRRQRGRLSGHLSDKGIDPCRNP